MEAIGGEEYSSYSFTTSALEGGKWSASRPDRALPPEERTPLPIGQEAGWASELVWKERLEEKSFLLSRVTNLDLPVVHSVDRQYTDWATPAPSGLTLLLHNREVPVSNLGPKIGYPY
jgi:hypothetical protein